MKAITVAGGTPDDPELERATKDAGAAADDTVSEPDAADTAGADEPPADVLPAADDEDEDGNGDGDGDGPKGREASPPATSPAVGGDEAPVETGKATGSSTQSAPATTASDDAPAAKTEAEAEAKGKGKGKADRSPGDAGPAVDSTAEARDDGEDGADAGAGAARSATEAVAEPPAGAVAAAEAAGDADADADADAQTTAGKGGDETQVLPAPPRSAAEPESDTEADEKADGTLTLGKPARDRAKDATEPAKRADAAASAAADSDGGGEDTRTVAFRAPDAAATGRKPQAGAAADRSGDDSDDAPSEGAEAPGGGRRGPVTDTAAKDEAKDEAKGETEGEGGGRKVPAWARGEEGDSERTSKFVAPAPLDVPASGAPQPRPRPEASATATPKAPLDLLAELTNTRPPAETPRRTVLRRVKVWTPILLLLAGGCVGAQLLRPLPAPRLVAAEASHAVDGQFSIPWPAKGQGAVRVPGSGEVGTFGEQKPVPTASVAKVMTAYVILKGHPLRKNEPGPDITVDAKAVAEGNSEDESRIQGLTVGAKFSQQDMLKMLMIPSGNNAGRLLARWDTGSDSEAAFVEKMNAAAKELGMKDTTYTDPSGLDAGTVSTANDQLKLAEAVMRDEVFRTVVAMPSAPIKGLAQPLINNNDLLSVQGLSVRGIKTGSSTPAGGALMWAAYKSVGDQTPLILGTLMDQRVEGPDPNGTKSLALALANSRKIIEAVRTALASTPLVRKGDTVGYVDDGLGGRTPLVATKDLNVIGVPGQQFKLGLGAGTSPLPHRAKAGTEVGTLTAGDGEGAKSVPVAVRNALAEPSVGARLTRLG